MSTSEFRYNKKRKHYAYLFKAIGQYRKNVLLSSKALRMWRGKKKKNVKLFKHPNPNSQLIIYVIPVVYLDPADCFYPKSLRWSFHKNDKRKIKRIKRIKI